MWCAKMADLSSVPTLEEKYSGTPSRLINEAKRAKALLYSNRTSTQPKKRELETPRLPPDVSRETFNQAIDELKASLGAQNVELNDKPLVDGWYLEHPSVIMIYVRTSTGG